MRRWECNSIEAQTRNSGARALRVFGANGGGVSIPADAPMSSALMLVRVREEEQLIVFGRVTPPIVLCHVDTWDAGRGVPTNRGANRLSRGPAPGNEW